MAIPTAKLGDREVSRLVCGSNPFMGYSYRSDAHSQWQREHFTPQRISEVLEKCLEVGINTLAGNYDENRTLARALDILERRTGHRMQWIAYTHGHRDESQEDSIASIADDGAFACYIQGGVVDSQFHYNYVGNIVLDRGDTLDRVIPWLALIREKGMLPGLGTHRHQILRLAEERGYEAEFYATPFNFTNKYCSYAEQFKAVRSTPKPIVAIKPMAGGGQIAAADALTCCFTGLKPTDVVAVGVENEHMVAHNARLTVEILEAVGAAEAALALA
ncbi:MAG: hypothetical protein PVH68_19925 [Armatimonadota bacterium]